MNDHSRPAGRRIAGLLAAAVASAAVLATSSCQILTGIFSWSMFPSFLSGVEATRNLSQELEDLVPEGSRDWGSDIAALLGPSSQEDYVFLAVYTPSGSRLLVLSSDLELINTVNDQPIGPRAMVDAAGGFVLGAVRLGDPPTGSPSLGTAGDWYAFGFSAGGQNFSFGQSTGNVLEYASYNSSWGSLGSDFPTIDLNGGNWSLKGLGPVVSRTGLEVMLALWSWERRLLAVVYTDQTGFAGGGFTGPVIDTGFDPPQVLAAGGFFLRGDEEEPRRVHYTAKGVLVRDQDREAKLYDFSGGELLKIHFGKDQIDDCYTADGERFYYFDRDQRMLFKGRTGW